MKKLLFVIVGLMALTLIAAPVMAGHDAAKCYPAAQAKVDVAAWSKDAVWEYVKEGVKYDALLAYIKTKPVTMPASIDGILITYITDPKSGAKRVFWAVSPDGVCVEMSTFQNMALNAFEAIVGKDV